MSAFLYYCAGSDRQLLQRCGKWERFRHSAVGTFVVLTGLMAFASGGYALSTIFEDSPQIALGVAALWGFLIFSLDRFIVMAMAETKAWRRGLQAIPRLILAVFIALVVARPLELRIFKEEIDAKIESQQAADKAEVNDHFDVQKANAEKRLTEKIQQFEGTTAVQAISDQINELNEALTTCRSQEQEALRSYHAEMDGSGGTRRRGIGPIAKAKKATYEAKASQCAGFAAQLQREVLRRDNQQKTLEKTTGDWRETAEKEFKGIEDERQDRLAQLDDYPDSFLQQHRALVLLQAGQDGVREAVLLITLLFVFIECAPIVTKLLTPPGHYEELLQSRKEDEKVVLQRAEFERKVELERADREQKIKIKLVRESRAEMARKGRTILESWKERVVPTELADELEESAKAVWSSALASKFAPSSKGVESTWADLGEAEESATAWATPEMRWLTLFMGVCLIAAGSFFVWKWTQLQEVAMAAGLMVAAIVKGISDYLSVATNRLVLAMGVCLVAASGFFMWRWTHQYTPTFSACLLMAVGSNWASNHWYKWREDKGVA